VHHDHQHDGEEYPGDSNVENQGEDQPCPKQDIYLVEDVQDSPQ